MANCRRPRVLLAIPLLTGLMLVADASARQPRANVAPNAGYGNVGRVNTQFRQPFSYGTSRYATPGYGAHPGYGVRNAQGVGIQGTSGGAVRNTSGTGIQGTSGGAVRNTSGVGIQGTSGGAVRNNPGTGIQGRSGGAVTNTSGVGIQGTSGGAVTNSPGVGIQGTSGGAVRNSSGIAVQNQPGIAVQNQPGIAVQNSPGIAVRNNPGIAVRNTPSSDAYTTHPDVIQNLPREHQRIRRNGRTWYYSSHRYYRPVYHGGGVCYVETYPPVGYVIDTLPDFAQTVVVDNTAYHTFNNTYYVTTTHDGRPGYEVVPPPGVNNQTKDTSQPSQPPASAPAVEPIDPFDLAQAMSDFLADQRGFTLVASDVYESIDDDGKPLRRTNRRTYNLLRPHNIIADIRGDDGHLRAYYDGHTLSIHHRDSDAYSTLPMPSTIDAMLDDLARRFDLTLPLADLLYDNVYEAVIGQAEQGQYLGVERVGPQETHHLIFWNDDIDWELWIDTGAEPLPRKFIITYKTLPGAPRYTATIRQWQLSPDFPPDHFRFRIPDGAQRVEIQPVRDDTAEEPGEDASKTRPS